MAHRGHDAWILERTNLHRKEESKNKKNKKNKGKKEPCSRREIENSKF